MSFEENVDDRCMEGHTYETVFCKVIPLIFL